MQKNPMQASNLEPQATLTLSRHAMLVHHKSARLWEIDISYNT